MHRREDDWQFINNLRLCVFDYVLIVRSYLCDSTFSNYIAPLSSRLGKINETLVKVCHHEISHLPMSSQSSGILRRNINAEPQINKYILTKY